LVKSDRERAADAVIDDPKTAAKGALALAEEMAQVLVLGIGRPRKGDGRREIVPILWVITVAAVHLARQIYRDRVIERFARQSARHTLIEVIAEALRRRHLHAIGFIDRRRGRPAQAVRERQVLPETPTVLSVRLILLGLENTADAGSGGNNGAIQGVINIGCVSRVAANRGRERVTQWDR